MDGVEHQLGGLVAMTVHMNGEPSLVVGGEGFGELSGSQDLDAIGLPIEVAGFLPPCREALDGSVENELPVAGEEFGRGDFTVALQR